MTKRFACGLLVLAVAAVVAKRLASGSSAAGTATPTLATKGPPRKAATSSRPVEGFEIPLVFGELDDEWSASQLRERHLERLNWRIGLLEERLALSPDQREQVSAWREQVARRLDTTGATAKASRSAPQRDLEAFLAPLLDDDQAAALATYKQQERTEGTEAITSGQLARMAEAIGLGPEQQAEVARIIAADAQAIAAFRLDDPRPMELFISNLDKDPQALGIEQLTWEWLGDDGLHLKPDHPRKRQFLKEVGTRIEARLASLEPVLTPEQGEIYREYLRKHWGCPFQQMLFAPPELGR